DRANGGRRRHATRRPGPGEAFETLAQIRIAGVGIDAEPARQLAAHLAVLDLPLEFTFGLAGRAARPGLARARSVPFGFLTIDRPRFGHRTLGARIGSTLGPEPVRSLVRQRLRLAPDLA